MVLQKESKIKCTRSDSHDVVCLLVGEQEKLIEVSAACLPGGFNNHTGNICTDKTSISFSCSPTTKEDRPYDDCLVERISLRFLFEVPQLHRHITQLCKCTAHRCLAVTLVACANWMYVLALFVQIQLISCERDFRIAECHLQKGI